jgi:hypothetical protein
MYLWLWVVETKEVSGGGGGGVGGGGGGVRVLAVLELCCEVIYVEEYPWAFEKNCVPGS